MTKVKPPINDPLEKVIGQKSNSGVGRRKKAVAVATIQPGSGYMRINHVPSYVYWKNNRILIKRASQCLDFVGERCRINAEIQVYGGGLVAQSFAVRLALTRAMCLINGKPNPNTGGRSEFLKKLYRREGLLTQDSRNKERKKYGLKKARKAPQYSKR
jgi:small subunit ribosomal protein S9